MRILTICGILAGLTGCSMSSSGSSHVQSSYTPTLGAPATATNHRLANGNPEFIWEEPMVDVIEVPPSMDPEGIYYRPPHKEVVEIRQGRYRYLGDVE